DSGRRSAISDWLRDSPIVGDVIRALTGGVADGVGPNAIESFVRDVLFQGISDASVNPQITGDGLAERLAEAAVLPMFGMPSRMRLLYHQLRGERALAIDRDLDLAVTEFAPGSQRTKDKRILEPIGFTAPLLYRAGRWSVSS